MSYDILLIIDGVYFHLPVLPEKLVVEAASRNRRREVLGVGEILQLRPKGLRTVRWEGLLPRLPGPYVTGTPGSPMAVVEAIERARDAGSDIQLFLGGFRLGINMRVGVQRFTYEERAGGVGDIHYAITLAEWRHYGPLRVQLPQDPEDFAALDGIDRSGQPSGLGSSYTVVKGDSLWAIARRHYGDGSRYPEIYAANQVQIDERNRKTGLSRYTIYPGQEFLIP